MNNEKEKQEAWLRSHINNRPTTPLLSFSAGFDAGIKSERERVKKVLNKFTDVDHVYNELFPEGEE